jgi:general secretion pathway protein G
VDNAKQSSLLSSLTVMRAAIDQFAADKDRYPDSLDELVRAGYLQAVPQDPFTGSRASWIVEAAPADGIRAGSVYDVHSGAAGLAPDGRPFSDW